jgi:inosine-uridine nucleoside N-ribohydrolase
MTQKILLDTDIGYDIDDAVCLAYLLMQPECDLLGITTVTGEAEARAQIASAICHAAGRRIPIYPGAEEPLIVPQKQTVAPQAHALEALPHLRNFARGEAIEFMRQMIRRNPNEVILLSIGPLTNIGLLFAIDPQIPTLLKGLVMMCGVFQPAERFAEWNAQLDPHAAAIVYRTNVPLHRSIGLDVTGRVALSAKQVRSMFSRHTVLNTVLKFAEVYFQWRDRIVFHDPLAAATIFDEDLCTFDKGTVDVELCDANYAGETRWKPDYFGDHEIAVTVDSQRFFEHYFSVFK